MSGQAYEQLTLFPADSPASPSPWLESKRAKGMIDTSGRRCSELSPSCARVALSVRTYLESSRLPPGRWSRIWSVQAITSSCSILKLRLVRYCCAELKEGGGKGRWIATGVRWAESQKRKSRGVMEALHRDKSKRLTLMNDNDESRMMMENCQLKGTRTVNPIIDWQDADIWDYCTAEKISMNPLYACGFERVGCIGCPMAGKHRKVQFTRYPKIKAAYVRAFDRMLAERQTRGLPCDWQTGEDVMHWWMEDGVLPGQMVLEGMEDTP